MKLECMFPRAVVLSVTAALLLSACSVFRPSASAGFDGVEPGMTKAEVVGKYGKPTLENISTYGGETFTVLTYIKKIYLNGEWREVTVDLTFLDGKLRDKSERIAPPKIPVPSAPPLH